MKALLQQSDQRKQHQWFPHLGILGLAHSEEYLKLQYKKKHLKETILWFGCSSYMYSRAVFLFEDSVWEQHLFKMLIYFLKQLTVTLL